MFGFDITVLIVVLVSILFSMTLHEAVHAFVGSWLGDDTAKEEGRLTLNPLSHIDPFTTVLMPLFLIMIGAPPIGAAKPVPFNPYKVRFGEFGAALVGVAGPLTNLVLAVIAGGFLRLFGDSLSDFWLVSVSLFILVNLSFFIFNMIPFPPLDGSRVLYAVAPDMLRRVMAQIESMGFAAIIFFIIIFYAVLSGPFISLLRWAFNLLVGGGQMVL